MFNIIEDDFKQILLQVDLSKAKGKKILVTGASGFLGQYIVGALSYANRTRGLNCKIEAIGLRPPGTLLKNFIKHDKNLLYRRINLSKTFNLKGYDYIFHGAGYGQPAKFLSDPISTVAINVDATIRLLNGSPKAIFVYFGAGSIYGEVPKKLMPVGEDYNGNTGLHEVRSVYVEAKRLGEALCASYHLSKKSKVKIVRIFHVYGPGLGIDDKRVITEFINKALTAKEIILADQGKAVKTYGYIADVVAMILYAGFSGKEMVYNVGGKDSISILELAKKIAEICKVECHPPKADAKFAHIGHDPSVLRFSLRRIEKEMKNFKFTDFSQGLQKTIQWHKELVANEQ